jgi:hypothetical protein
LFLVFILTEIEDFADWRIGIGRDFDEIETGLDGHGERFVAPDNTHHLAPLVDEAYARDADLVIDPGSLTGGSEIQRWSGYVLSPLGG